jgi:hypothetical protein
MQIADRDGLWHHIDPDHNIMAVEDVLMAYGECFTPYR